MKNKGLIIFISVLFILLRKGYGLTPDEGLWLPIFQNNYNYNKMRLMGLRLTEEQLYSVDKPSIKDAIVLLGDNLGSGAIISKDGLLISSYSNAYNYVVANSSEEKNYVKEGFWAKNREQELPCPGLTATFLISMKNVTQDVLEKIPENATPIIREKWIENNIELLINKESRKGDYQVVVKPFFNGIEYYLFVYQTYKDIRLVGVPPHNVALFGGDHDSWSWARYAADFSLFRIYMSPDSTVATYDTLNIPLAAKYALPINLQGVMDGDFTMYMGYPTRTQRYKTSYEVNNIINKINPAFSNAFDIILPIIRREIYKNEKVRLGYSSMYNHYINLNKHIKGENTILKNSNVLKKKENQEKIIREWLTTDSALQQRYGDVFTQIDSICQKINGDVVNSYWYGNIAILTSKMMALPYELRNCRPQKGKRKLSEEEKQELLATYRQLTEHLNQDLEIKIITSHFDLWKKLPEAMRPQIYPYITKFHAGDVNAFAKAVVTQSFFSSEKNFTKFLKRFSIVDYWEDPLIRYFYSIIHIIHKGEQPVKQYSQDLIEPQMIYNAALKKMSNNYNLELYPEANSTMRYSFGKISSYEPYDAIRYQFLSSHKGILEKYKAEDPEFSIPFRLKEMFEQKDFAHYDIDGFLPICFITDNDYTEGCSGSAILNRNGEIVGCAFDGNREALGNNITYNSLLHRTICVDIRYIIFLIDKYAEAGSLLNEMTLIH